jgi:hypothetical protein
MVAVVAVDGGLIQLFRPKNRVDIITMISSVKQQINAALAAL